MTYTMRYGHAANAIPGTLTLDAKDDANAVAELREFVAAGYRSETWANVDLSDGRTFGAHNKSGIAIGRYV